MENDLTPEEAEWIAKAIPARLVPPLEPEPAPGDVPSVIEEMFAAARVEPRPTDFQDSQLVTLDEVIATSDDLELVEAAKHKRAVLVLEGILADAIETDQAAFETTAAERRAEQERQRLLDLHNRTKLQPDRVITTPSKAERVAAQEDTERLARDPAWIAQQDRQRERNNEIDLLLQQGRREEAEALAESPLVS